MSVIKGIVARLEQKCGVYDEQAIQDWKLDHYSRLYEAGVSLWEMMDYVKTKKITAQCDLEDFVAIDKRR